MDCLLEPIQCTKCFEQLKNPVVLPCGNAICEKHQNEDRDDNNSVYCSVCDLHHAIPNGGFLRNLALEKLIERKINCIDLGNEYRSAYDKLENFSDLFDRFEKLKNDPGEQVNSKISELRNKIDLRREELKSQIDKDALSIIKQLDEYEKDCMANIPLIKEEIENNEKLNEWKQDLDRWRQQMQTFEKDVNMWKKILEESSLKYDEMRKAFNRFHKGLFLNKLNDYKDLKLFIGNDFDMIKNHSLTCVVKNFARTIKNNKDIVSYSETFRAFGLDWYLSVDTSTDYKTDEAIKYVAAFLHVEGNFTQETCNVSFDIMILHRTDPSRNIIGGIGNHSIIKLNDLINNDGLYDAENDCFTVQIRIKSVEFKNIEEDTNDEEDLELL